MSEERQRQRAKFESRLNRFKSVDESGGSGAGGFARSNSTEVRNKAEYFSNIAQGKKEARCTLLFLVAKSLA